MTGDLKSTNLRILVSCVSFFFFKLAEIETWFDNLLVKLSIKRN